MSDKNYISIYAKSFSWAGFFLPKETFKKCSALYDFCRVADNIADNDEKIENKEKKFSHFENDFNQKNLNNPIIKNMWGLIEEFNISLKIVQDLLIGIKSDIKNKVKLDSKKDLLIYSYRVAGTVGLMMAKILRVNKESSLKSAIDLGIAMQLTNIARDVCEDKARNRQYIKHDFTSIKETIDESQIFYNNSFKSISSIPLRSRFSVIVARRVYRKIGDYILRQKNIENYNNGGKIYVPIYAKIVQTFLSFLDFINLLFVKELQHDNHTSHNILKNEININERF